MNITEQKINTNFKMGRILASSVLSVLLCMSGFLSVFTPLPVGVSSLMYGRYIGVMQAVVTTLLFFYMIFQASNAESSNYSFAYFFAGSMLIALALAEVIQRKLNPIKGIVYIGATIVLGCCLALWIYLDSTGLSLNDFVMEQVKMFTATLQGSLEEIKKSNYENALEIEALIKQPQKIVDEVLTIGPGLIIASFYVIIWTNMYLMLAFKRILAGEDEKYNERMLLQFKVPEKAIFGVILGLILVLTGTQIGEGASELGFLILIVLGVFYFFHGIGIYFEFLNYFKITGVWRSILVVLTLLTAYQIIALVGLFDMFVNFRKFFKRKNLNE